MGKKNKEQGPVANLNSVANRDIIQRINFLYQASTYLSTISHSAPSNTAQPQPKGFRYSKKNAIRHPKSAADLSRSYVGSIQIVGQKTMVRMDPSLKRTLCKQCDTVLIPGSTASVRVKPSGSHGHTMVYTCITCMSSRRIPAPPILNPDVTIVDDTISSTVDHPSKMNEDAIKDDTTPTDVMNADAALTTFSGSKKRKAKKARKPVSRVPPLFERKGHVVFRGNERVTDDSIHRDGINPS